MEVREVDAAEEVGARMAVEAKMEPEARTAVESHKQQHHELLARLTPTRPVIIVVEGNPGVVEVEGSNEARRMGL